MAAKSNVLILGGGAIGLCAAYYLSRDGASVTIIDKGELGHGSSLHNAGYISPSHFVPLASPGLFSQALKWMVNPRSPLYIKPRLDLDMFAWAWQFRKACDERIARRAIPLLSDLLKDSSGLTDELARVGGMNFDLQKRGLCILYNTEKGKRALVHEAALAEEVRVKATLLDRSSLAKLDPAIEFRAEGGLFFPGDSHLVPAAFVRDMAAYLELQGVRVLRNCPVNRVDVSGTTVKAVETSNGRIQADEFVFSAGAWLPMITRSMGVRLLLQAGKGYSLTVKNPAVKPLFPHIFQERRVAITPFADSLRFAGTMEFAGVDLNINRTRVNAILDAVPMYYANVQRPSITDGEVWAGLRPVSPDGMPYLGRLRQYPNAIMATGHAMLGISLCTVTGKLVAEILGGRTPSHDLTQLNPNRYD